MEVKTAVGEAWLVGDGITVISPALKRQTEKDSTFSHRLYSAAELRALLEECGFKAVEIYGDLAGAPCDHEAKRLVAVAHK